MKRSAIIALGVAAVVAETALIHGPLGFGERYAQSIDRTARAELDYQGMVAVTGTMQRHPLRRRVLLSGPADDFQERELIRIIGGIPGAADARWTFSSAHPVGVR